MSLWKSRKTSSAPLVKWTTAKQCIKCNLFLFVRESSVFMLLACVCSHSMTILPRQSRRWQNAWYSSLMYANYQCTLPTEMRWMTAEWFILLLAPKRKFERVARFVHGNCICTVNIGWCWMVWSLALSHLCYRDSFCLNINRKLYLLLCFSSSLFTRKQGHFHLWSQQTSPLNEEQLNAKLDGGFAPFDAMECRFFRNIM